MRWLELLAHETSTIAAALGDAELDVPIAGCPGWTVADLAAHLGQIQRWVVHAVRRQELLDDYPAFLGGDVREWFADGAAAVLEALDVDPDTPAATFAPDQVVGFWQRRQVHEHRIHRWDLEAALGTPEPVDAALAHDGLDEVATMFWPRQVRRGRAPMPPRGLRVVTTDTGGDWSFGTAPKATLAGPAADLLLVLWHRLPADLPSLAWSGDHAEGLRVLALALAP